MALAATCRRLAAGFDRQRRHAIDRAQPSNDLPSHRRRPIPCSDSLGGHARVWSADDLRGSVADPEGSQHPLPAEPVGDDLARLPRPVAIEPGASRRQIVDAEHLRAASK